MTDVEGRKEISVKEQDGEIKRQCEDNEVKKSTGESEICRERETDRQRAGQIWATVTLGRWLWALSSVYITLTVQAKTAMRQK